MACTQQYKEVDMSESKVIVMNNSRIDEAKRLVECTAYYLQMRNMKIIITPMDRRLINKKMDKDKTKAFVQYMNPMFYRIHVNSEALDNDFSGLLRVICHEMIHVKQLKDKRLEHLDAKGNVKFLGKEYNVYKKKYEDQPHEQEAEMMAERIESQVKKRYFSTK
jgi:hypothetical protein